MNISLLIDTREISLIENINERDLDIYKDNIKIETKQLELGDIQLIFNDRLLVFERKTINDLISSVKDGRYKEQKSRLLSNINNTDITYIIEGDDILCNKNERHQKILSSIFLRSLYRDNIKIIFTKNIIETVTFLLTLSCKIIDNPLKFNKEDINDIEYINTIKIKSKKIDNITPNNCYIMQLSQIPSISSIIAKNISKIYPTMRDLLNMLNTIENNNERIIILCKIDKIGKEKAKKILEYFVYN